MRPTAFILCADLLPPPLHLPFACVQKLCEMREADESAHPTFDAPSASTRSDLKALERALEQATVELSSIRLESSEEEEVEEEVVAQKEVAEAPKVEAEAPKEEAEPLKEVAAPKKAFWFF
jgi:hypothetical protein